MNQSIKMLAMLATLVLALFFTQVAQSAPVKSSHEINVQWVTFEVELTNPHAFYRDEVICITSKNVAFDIKQSNAYIVKDAQTTVPSQVASCIANTDELGLAILLPLNANESKTVKVHVQKSTSLSPTHRSKTHAELQVRVGGDWKQEKLTGGEYISVEKYTLPKDHTVGNKLFKYEGFGWESQKVAYRYYFDHRGSIDIFGKLKNGLFLDEVGIDGDDYHILDHWGMDILKVGPSLGLGGIAAWQNDKLFGANTFSDLLIDIKNQELFSSVNLHYKDWLVDEQEGDLQLSLSIAANSLLTHVKAKTTANIERFATGIVKHGVEKISKKNAAGKWSYIATWGEQSLAKDNLGMAIFVETELLESFSADKYNELVLFKASAKPVSYYFSANWSASPNGAKDKKAFVEYLEKTLATLNQPILINSK